MIRLAGLWSGNKQMYEKVFSISVFVKIYQRKRKEKYNREKVEV